MFSIVPTLSPHCPHTISPLSLQYPCSLHIVIADPALSQHCLHTVPSLSLPCLSTVPAQSRTVHALLQQGLCNDFPYSVFFLSSHFSCTVPGLCQQSPSTVLSLPHTFTALSLFSPGTSWDNTRTILVLFPLCPHTVLHCLRNIPAQFPHGLSCVQALSPPCPGTVSEKPLNSLTLS